MKKSLFYLLIVVVIAGWIGTLMARDAGYVLIAYDGATLQTSLWVMLGILLGLGLVALYFYRLFHIVGGAAKRLSTWKEGEQLSRSTKLASKGLIYLQEGSFERAEKFLLSAAKASEYPAANFIYAAKAADRQGLSKKREEYLKKARLADADAKTEQSIAVASAEMAAMRGEWQACLGFLQNSDINKLTLALKTQCLTKLEDWQSLEEIFPQIRKYEDATTCLELERKLVLAKFSQPAHSDNVLIKKYKKVSDTLRGEEVILMSLFRALKSEKEKEALLRKALMKNWQPALVEVYGALGKETLKRRVKTAEAWLEVHNQDAALQFCLGQLYEALGDRERAKLYYTKSVELGGNQKAGSALAKLLISDGELEKSSENLQQLTKA